MMTLAVYARADHPAGYGFGEKAHGFVVLVVQCVDDDELVRVSKHLETGVLWPTTPQGMWYGGRFDLVWSAHVNDDTLWCITQFGDLWLSRGDNRAMAYVRGSHVLALASTPTALTTT